LNQEQLIHEYQDRVEQALEHWLPLATIPPGTLHEAMRYSALGGGKRVRPLLAYATGAALDVPLAQLDGPACAVEIIHAYSLVHDDLPAMDNDELRRGKPTCHIAFDEATAILAGDALQALAFYVLAHDPAMVDDAALRLQMVDMLAYSSGSHGMAGGQAIDLESVGKTLNLAELENMHIHKTGALIRASVRLATLSHRGLDPALTERLDHFAKCIGLAFQIHDDILDVESDTETLGKPQGADMERNKPTYPAIVGLAESRNMAKALHQEALDSLADLDSRADTLRWLADYIVARKS
jgi:geranylgeranyl diphosphate synthase type II